MDFESVSAEEFGRSLKGIGINLLVRDVHATAAFLTEVFSMQAFRLSADFAIMRFGQEVFQLHADHTYRAHPLPSLLPEAGPRGAGAEFRLYGCDPDEAVGKADERGDFVLQRPADKPHGLREAFIIDRDGYCWVPSKAKEDDV